MANAHWIIDRLLEAHKNKQIKLPPATFAFIESTQIKALAVPPDLTLEEATILEVLYRTYLQRN